MGTKSLPGHGQWTPKWPTIGGQCIVVREASGSNPVATPFLDYSLFKEKV